MKKFLLMMGAALLALSVQAENLLFNADFKQIKNENASGWSKVGGGKVTFNSQEGFVRLENDADAKKSCSIRQNVFKKVQVGKKYRIECKVRGDKFVRNGKSDYGMLLINRSWKGNAGTRRFIVTDGKWVTMSKVVTIPENWTDVTVVIFTAAGSGALEFSNISLTEVK